MGLQLPTLPGRSTGLCYLAKQLGGGVENVNIRLALMGNSTNFSNHKHPHISLQCKGVLGEWGGAEAGGTSDSFEP